MPWYGHCYVHSFIQQLCEREKNERDKNRAKGAKRKTNRERTKSRETGERIRMGKQTDNNGVMHVHIEPVASLWLPFYHGKLLFAFLLILSPSLFVLDVSPPLHFFSRSFPLPHLFLYHSPPSFLYPFIRSFFSFLSVFWLLFFDFAFGKYCTSSGTKVSGTWVEGWQAGDSSKGDYEAQRGVGSCPFLYYEMNVLLLLLSTTTFRVVLVLGAKGGSRESRD